MSKHLTTFIDNLLNPNDGSTKTLLFDDDEFNVTFLGSQSGSKFLGEHVHSIDIPETSISTKRILDGSIHITGKEFSNINVTFYENNEYDVRKFIRQWIDDMIQTRIGDTNYGGQVLKYEDSTSVTISINNKVSNKVQDSFLNAKPINTGSFKYDSSSEGNVILLTVPFIFSHSKIT